MLLFDLSLRTPFLRPAAPTLGCATHQGPGTPSNNGPAHTVRLFADAAARAVATTAASRDASVLANLRTGRTAVGHANCTVHTVHRINRSCVRLSRPATRSRSILPLRSGILALPTDSARAVGNGILECPGATARTASAHQHQHQHDVPLES